jgi:hypothetical protein
MAMPDMVSGASADADAESAPLPGDKAPPVAGQGFMFGGDYWVFVLQDGAPVARQIRTGLTDLDYSEVLSGLTVDDQIILLPSSDLIMSQDRFKQWMGQMVGVPGTKSQEGKDKGK